MLNLISFYFDHNFIYRQKDDLKTIINSLKIHIDTMHQNGWSKDQIIIKTNFDFSYKDIKSQPFKYNNFNNLFLSKIVAAYEVLSEYPEEILWQHDHDMYQLKPFDIDLLKKQLQNEVTLCNYWPNNNRPQGAGVFYRYLSQTLKDLYKYILKENINLCDELFFIFFMSNFNHDISLSLPYDYNTSITKHTATKRFSNDPFCIHGDIRRKFDKKLYHQYMRKNL
jgi:hypothetical protein